jgi:hypothetical protein
MKETSMTKGMLRKTLAAAALSMAAVTVAGPATQAGLFTGADLLRMCTSTALQEQTFCKSYLTGVRDTAQVIAALGHAQGISCMYSPDPDYTWRVYVQYMRDHPEELPHPAAAGAIEAFSRRCAGV